MGERRIREFSKMFLSLKCNACFSVDSIYSACPLSKNRVIDISALPWEALSVYAERIMPFSLWERLTPLVSFLLSYFQLLQHVHRGWQGTSMFLQRNTQISSGMKAYWVQCLICLVKPYSGNIVESVKRSFQTDAGFHRSLLTMLLFTDRTCNTF